MLHITKGSVTHVPVGDKTKAGAVCEAKSCREPSHDHYRIAFSYNAGQGRKQKVGWRFHTKSEGQDALDDWRAAVKADPALLSLSYGDWRKGKAPRIESTVQGADQTFRQWAAHWLKGKRHRATTAEAASKYLLGKVAWDSAREPKGGVAEALLPDGRTFGDLRLNQINWRDVRDGLRAEAAHREGGIYRTYTLRGWSYLGPCLRAAAVEYDLDSKIGDRDYVKPPKASEVKAEAAKQRRERGEVLGARLPWQRWNLEHAERAYRHVAEHHGRQWTAIMRMTLGLGLRRAEICGLRWRDIDLDGRTVHVRTSRSESSNGVIEENEPKNGETRLLALSQNEYDALEHWAKDQAVLLGTDVAPPDGYVFVGDMGGPWRPKNLSDVQWRAIAKELVKLGVPGPISFHALRKISGAFEINYFGGSIETVAKRLGHKNIQVTWSHYAYIAEDKERGMATARDRL